MNNKSDEKIVGQQGSDKPARTVLRLVSRDEREQHETEPGTARNSPADRKIQKTTWDGDDDDPEPAAA